MARYLYTKKTYPVRCHQDELVLQSGRLSDYLQLLLSGRLIANTNVSTLRGSSLERKLTFTQRSAASVQMSTLAEPIYEVLIVARSCGMTADLIVLILTWRRAWPLSATADFNNTLAIVLFNDGRYTVS